MPMTARVVCCVAVFLVALVPLHATPIQRTFVSATSGDDTHACSRSAPCRNFAAAMAATAPDGEIVVLDSGGYGAVTVDRPVSIIAPSGVYAGITGFTGAAVTVDAGASANVNIRGLSLNSQGASTGIEFKSGASLHVENCVLNAFPLYGIKDLEALGTLFVLDTTIRNGALNTPASAAGIYVGNSTTDVYAFIDSTRVDSYYVGVLAADHAKVTMRKSSSSNNQLGVVAQSVSAGFAYVTVSDCSINFNNDGLMAGLDGGSVGGAISVSNSVISYSKRWGAWTQLYGTITMYQCEIISTGVAARQSGPNAGEGGTWTWGGNRIVQADPGSPWAVHSTPE